MQCSSSFGADLHCCRNLVASLRHGRSHVQAFGVYKLLVSNYFAHFEGFRQCESVAWALQARTSCTVYQMRNGCSSTRWLQKLSVQLFTRNRCGASLRGGSGLPVQHYLRYITASGMLCLLTIGMVRQGSPHPQSCTIALSSKFFPARSSITLSL